MKKIIVLSLLILFASCSTDTNNSKYLRWVGDSVYTLEIDTTEFKLCNSESSVRQYFHFNKGLQYKGEKEGLRTEFKQEYTAVDTDQSGWIRIRFIVNCEGNTGRFRIIESDMDYQEQVFDERIINQILKITQSLDGWKVQSMRDKPTDYYQYLIFKIIKGDIIEIMP